MGGTENTKYDFLCIRNQDGKTLYKLTMPITTISQIGYDDLNKIKYPFIVLPQSIEFDTTCNISFWTKVKLFGFWSVVKSKISHIFRRYKKNA